MSRKPADRTPSRIAPMEVLPVFMSLCDRTVVVAGDTAAAAWKAELLAAAGARVAIFARFPHSALLALVERGSEAGAFVLERRTWVPSDLCGAALAVCDAGDDDEAASFMAAARSYGTPVNVIDRPQFCTVQFGSIVNRSPVVIGVSSSGSAPALAQAVRRRIETLLPPAIGAWAALARRIRPVIRKRLPLAAVRRSFWSLFAENAFTGLPPEDEGSVVSDIENSAGRGYGKVTLVGAGPGDAGLLTMQAVRALQSADVILFDDLVSDEVLELARREAKRLLVGKRGRRESCRQEDINATMLKLARQGKQVVRLKSGDPGIFGRAGEELAALSQHGIATEVVPGITAGIALASRLGVSLTHRDFAHSVRFVTGHSRHGNLPADLDWRGLADPETTTLFYMAGRTAKGVAGRLVAEGLSPSTPLIIASSVSRAEEHRWAGRLANVAEGIAEVGFDAPVLLAIGNVFASAVQAEDGRERSVARSDIAV